MGKALDRLVALSAPAAAPEAPASPIEALAAARSAEHVRVKGMQASNSIRMQAHYEGKGNRDLSIKPTDDAATRQAKEAAMKARGISEDDIKAEQTFEEVGMLASISEADFPDLRESKADSWIVSKAKAEELRERITQMHDKDLDDRERGELKKSVKEWHQKATYFEERARGYDHKTALDKAQKAKDFNAADEL